MQLLFKRRQDSLGIYINPGNEGFNEIRKGEYVDKSGLLSVVNRTLSTDRRLSCVSRARRFGKSYAAQMVAAYYSTGCDSEDLFSDLKISKDISYREHINKYNVLFLDIAGFFCGIGPGELASNIATVLKRELFQEFPYISKEGDLKECLINAVRHSGRQFIAVIDEWDAPIRLRNCTEEAQYEYLELLRTLFKSQITKQVFAGVYMTGILPIKKDGSQSAISEFREYSMLFPGEYAPYIGLLDEEVKDVCESYGVSFEKMKEWYNGYEFNYGEKKIAVYNINSVMEAAYNNAFRSYWRETGAANSLMDYINMDFDSLGDSAEKLLAGLEIPVKVSGFANDLVSFRTADDVLTMLIHFGYLSYDEDKSSVHIPNNEVALEFADAIHGVKHGDTIKG